MSELQSVLIHVSCLWRYLECNIKGELREHLCPDGFVFDITLEKCDYPVKVNCSTRPQLQATLSNHANNSILILSQYLPKIIILMRQLNILSLLNTSQFAMSDIPLQRSQSSCKMPLLTTVYFLCPHMLGWWLGRRGCRSRSPVSTAPGLTGSSPGLQTYPVR